MRLRRARDAADAPPMVRAARPALDRQKRAGSSTAISRTRSSSTTARGFRCHPLIAHGCSRSAHLEPLTRHYARRSAVRTLYSLPRSRARLVSCSASGQRAPAPAGNISMRAMRRFPMKTIRSSGCRVMVWALSGSRRGGRRGRRIKTAALVRLDHILDGPRGRCDCGIVRLQSGQIPIHRNTTI